MDLRTETEKAMLEALFGVLKALVAAVLTVLPVFWLWNAVMPALGLPTLTFFQAWGVLLLVDLLLAGNL